MSVSGTRDTPAEPSKATAGTDDVTAGGPPESTDGRGEAGADDAGVSDELLDAALGPARATVEHFHDLLVKHGVTRGLIGPREAPRLWARHLLNSAAVAQLLPVAGRLVDVGTGAGLPGVVLAALRPDLEVVLVEPMERRVTWLREVVAELGLASTEVLRGRAEELHGRLSAQAVTARAVAPLDRLAGWALPLLEQGGVLLAMKGENAAVELASAAGVIDQWGGGPGEVLAVSAGGVSTRVVRVVRARVVAPAARPRRASRR